MEKFTESTLEVLNTAGKGKYYVYRLVDPRTYHTFYVGKGCGNRVFDHARLAQSLQTNDEDTESLKLKQISDIIASGKEVVCFIHRWGLTESAAFEVEAALIDCYAGLTNIQGGHDQERGMITAEDLEEICHLQEYDEPVEDYIIIKTTQGAIEANGNLYEATRRSWRADLRKAQKYRYVLSVIHGVVKEVYTVDRWYSDGYRIAFDGHVTTDSISALKGHQIPAKYRKKGMATPFLYKK